MPLLDDVITISTSLATAFVTRAGFGTPLILGFHTRFTENVKTYSSLAAMISDGFTVNDPVYKMASGLFGQNPRPPQVKVGRLPTPPSAQVTRFMFTGWSAGQTVTMNVVAPDGTSTAVSQAFDTDVNTSVAALSASVNAVAGLSTTTNNDSFDATADSNGAVFFFERVTGPAQLLDITGDWAYDTQLSAILNEDPGFYTVSIDVNSGPNVLDVAAWVASRRRLAFFAPQSTSPAAYNSVAATALRTGTNQNAISAPTKQGRSRFHELRWLGVCLTRNPGSQTWAFKRAQGASADPWTDTEVTTLDAANNNYVRDFGGLSVFYPGRAHGGQFIDITRGIHWTEARMQEGVANALANNDKIPYTDDGVAIIADAIEAVLDRGVQNGLFVAGSTRVNVLPVADQDEADRGNRILDHVEYEATLAGAVHNVRIRGRVTV